MPSAQEVQDRVGVYALDASGQFDLRYSKAPSARAEYLYNQVCQTVDAQALTERFAGVKGIAGLTPHDGDVRFGGEANWETSVVSSEFSTGQKYTWKQLRSDEKNLKALEMLPAKLAAKALKKKYSLFFDTLIANPAWSVDGQNVFSGSHEFGDNNLSLNVADPANLTESDVLAILELAQKTFGNYTDDHGDPIMEVGSEFKPLLIGKMSYRAAFRRLANQMHLVRDGAAIDNIEADAFDFWDVPDLRIGTGNTVYVILPADADGEDGTAPAFARTEFDPYTLTAGGGPDDPVWRKKREVETTIYGIEGVGCVNAQRAIKISLT